MNDTFGAVVEISGGLQSSYVFTDANAAQAWINSPSFRELALKFQEYGTLTAQVRGLPGLKVGDKCNVWGEAADVFTITGLVRFSENRYGFVLDGQEVKDIASCHIGHLSTNEE